MDPKKQGELKKKLERMEALYARPGSPGEKQAAAIAINRLKSRLQALAVYQKIQVREYTFQIFTDA